jgi:NADH:ubiquinone oxidoreductase subunit E
MARRFTTGGSRHVVTLTPRSHPHIFGALARAQGNIPMSLEFSAEAQKKIAALIEKYPSAGSKQPVVLAALHLAQRDFGYLSDDALRLVAATLDLPYAHVYGVATFYTMFRRTAGGATTIRMCTNISCMLRGGYEVLAAFEQKLGLKAGESNKEFTLVEEECIAACANAPCALAGTTYLLDLTPSKVDQAIAELRGTPHPEHEVL